MHSVTLVQVGTKSCNVHFCSVAFDLKAQNASPNIAKYVKIT